MKNLKLIAFTCILFLGPAIFADAATFQIKNKTTKELIHQCESISMKACVESAISQGKELEGVDLDYADLSGANLKNARFRGASLKYVNFTNANLTGADLSNTRMKGAVTTGATMTGINMLGSVTESYGFDDVVSAVNGLLPSFVSLQSAIENLVLGPQKAGNKTITVSAVVTTTSVKIANANPNRMGLIIYNNSANSAYIAYGQTANSSNSMTRILATFAQFAMEAPVYTGDIYAIRNSGTGTLIITELTE